MSNYGFVYILGNTYMPNAYKVGCTERSPHQRAQELSAHTGVPADFYVVCYLECTQFQEVERQLHRYLSNYRVSPNREFFRRDCMLHAIGFLENHPNMLTFSVVDYYVLHKLCDDEGFTLKDAPDPWKDGDPIATRLACVGFGASRRLPAELRVIPKQPISDAAA